MKSPRDYRASIIKLLAERGVDKTICPSELLPLEDKKNPELMDQVRQSARLLAAEGHLEFTQKGVVVDPNDFRGPVRLRLPR